MIMADYLLSKRYVKLRNIRTVQKIWADMFSICEQTFNLLHPW